MILNKRRYSRNGFSLVEILLGLAIFSIIVVTLYSTFWSGIKVDERAEEKNYTYANWALEQMAKELKSASVYNFSFSYPDQKEFIGESDRIAFILPTDEGLKFVEYYLDNEEEIFVRKVIMGKRSKKNISVTQKNMQFDERKILVRQEFDFADYVSGKKINSLTESVCLNVALEGLKFSYAYIETFENESKLVWEDSWIDNYTPAGIKVELSLVGSESGEAILVHRNIYIPAGFWGEEAL